MINTKRKKINKREMKRNDKEQEEIVRFYFTTLLVAISHNCLSFPNIRDKGKFNCTIILYIKSSTDPNAYVLVHKLVTNFSSPAFYIFHTKPPF